eukprot:NODE_6380_length_456_cov_36.479115_g4852_i0.p1 GENE.NODE_6380_length_456_cov_36.479115_g4852_i0~~NODE_6380_length_456_cov_36.479115_g4852_i0.p1  ORF type:complete len:98 (-),score=4.74 NODE_6380_length_456_cov_36.479115_g4852_i0:163-435(-)
MGDRRILGRCAPPPNLRNLVFFYGFGVYVAPLSWLFHFGCLPVVWTGSASRLSPGSPAEWSHFSLEVNPPILSNVGYKLPPPLILPPGVK